MKQTVVLLTVALLISCKEKQPLKAEKDIIIAGKVIDYDKRAGKNILTIYINDTGRATQLNFPTKIDSLGHFHVTFQRYYPQDVMISFETNFRVIVHPVIQRI